MNIRRKIGLVVLLCLLSGLSTPAWSEFPWKYPPGPGADPSGEISRNVHLGRYETAIQMLLAVAEATTDPSTEARALQDAGTLTAIFLQDKETARTLYQQVAEKYPNSRQEIYARQAILDLDFPQPGAARLEALGQFLQSFGGPTLAEVEQGGNLEANVAAIESLHPEIAYALAPIYNTRAYELRNEGKREQALNVLRFGRRALDPVRVNRFNDFFSLYSEILARESGISFKEIGAISVDPKIHVLSPAEGSTVGPQVDIQVELSSGDYRHTQVDLQSLQVFLDGQDVTYEIHVSSVMSETLMEGVDFEKVTLSLQRQLSPGKHEVKVSTLSTRAVTISGTTFDTTFGQATKTWNFTVAENPPSPDPISQTFPTTKDTTLLIRNPHQNEGANPRLHLKKETGKPAQVLVGFNTANIDTSGLTKATLVLTIDSTQNVTGWGNGRPIRAQRLLTAWTEGNGKNLDLPNNQKTAGSGSGATWFSPIDSNISNNFADSTVNWNGGATYAAPSTAPTVIIKNHQSGEVTLDVTQDLINGAAHGWLITRDQDVGSQITFLSKEGGSSDLAPKLLLEYGDSVAKLNTDSTGLLASMGLGKAFRLATLPRGTELKSPRSILQDNPTS